MVGQGLARRRRASRLHPARLAVLPVVCLLLSGMAGAAAYFFPVVVAGVGQTGQTVVVPPNNSAKVSPTPSAPPGSPFTVLLLGSDDDSKFQADHVLTQSMILVRVEPATKRVTMLSIPRDLWVPLSTGGKAKASTLTAADLPDIVDALKGEFKTSMGLDRVRSLLGVAAAFDLANVKQVVLYACPSGCYTSYGNGAQYGGQSVVVPHWNQILPVVKASFP